MNPRESHLVPFLTRDLLKFGREAKFELILVSQANVATTIILRTMDRNGISKFPHTTVSTGQLTTTTHSITDIPLSVSIKNDLGTLIQGDCYVTLSLRVNGEIVYELGAGFVYGAKSVTWPANNAADGIPGRGRIREFSQAGIGPDEEVSITVPAGRVWHILALSVTLVTSATVANRRVRLILGGNLGLTIASFSSIDQIASLTRIYSAAQYGAVPDEFDGNKILISIPSNIYLPQDGLIVTDTLNFASGDTYGAVAMLIEEFFVPPT